MSESKTNVNKEPIDEDVIQANADSITQHGIVTSRLQLNKN